MLNRAALRWPWKHATVTVLAVSGQLHTGAVAMSSQILIALVCQL